MSNSSKGTGLELRAKKVLEAAGYLVHRTVKTPVVAGGKIIGSHANDVFGCFDLIAVGGNPAMPRLRFVQVTMIDDMGRRQAKVSKVAVAFPSSIAGDSPGEFCSIEHVLSCEVWGWVGGRRHLDQRFKDKQVWIEAQYFRVVQWRADDMLWQDVEHVSGRGF